MSATARMMDANLNRALEGLRMLEDLARFQLNDATLSESFKAMRHRLLEAVKSLSLPAGRLEAARDVGGDVGTGHSAPGERTRATVAGIAQAAAGRLGEALRVLEECAKLHDEPASARLKRLRYEAYDRSREIILRLGIHQVKPWKLCLLLTQARCKRPWEDVLTAAIEEGADCIQVREKAMGDRELLAHIKWVVKFAQEERGVPVIVNDRADLALLGGAAGVHLGQGDLAVEDVRKIAGRELIMGVSAHSMREAEQGMKGGTDYLGVGTMFPTATKTDLKIVGPGLLREVRTRWPQVPLLAIGGITTENAREVLEAGLCGLAVSAAICMSENPRAVSRELLRRLNH